MEYEEGRLGECFCGRCRRAADMYKDQSSEAIHTWSARMRSTSGSNSTLLEELSEFSILIDDNNGDCN